MMGTFISDTLKLYLELIFLSWMTPPVGSFKLNFDESVIGNPGPSSNVSVIRGSSTKCMLSFVGPSCFGSANKTELLAVRMGLRQPARLDLNSFVAEGDSLCAASWASGFSKLPWRLAVIAEEVLDLAVKLNVSFVHMRRSANEVVDSMAKEGFRRPELIIETSIYFFALLGVLFCLFLFFGWFFLLQLLSICLICCLAFNKI